MSKIVEIIQEEIDKLAKPFKKTLYHGSNYIFDKFDSNMIGKNADAGWYSKGIYFTEAKPLASYYGRYAYVCEVTLSNPFYAQVGNKREFMNVLELDNEMSPEEITKYLINKGYDGVVILDYHNPDFVSECVVYDSNSIKILKRE